MKTVFRILLGALFPCFCLSAWGQETGALNPDTVLVDSLDDVVIATRRSGTLRLAGAENGFNIGRDELFRAACCNLGESFTTNPSVDVNYSDATTGARQIRLLGLSGTYVQMLTEQLPNFRGSALPYALGYVPGPWMQSIQVSKGASSVRNGFESLTGQINIEYLKPEQEEGAALNVYANTKSRIEANADANIHIKGKVNTEVLAHYEDDFARMDENHDGFVDQPSVRQVNVQNRWDYLGRKYIFHGGLGLIDEKREGGQKVESSKLKVQSYPPYRIQLYTRRYETYMKHAVVLNPEHGTNVALMASGCIHQLDALFGTKTYNTDERNGYLQLMFETNFAGQCEDGTPQLKHTLSAGASLNYDDMEKRETTPGIYAQYTLDLGSRLTAMAGLRLDHSSIYGTFLTPRAHVKYAPVDWLTLRASAGKGYRSPHPLAENHYLLASGRQLVIDNPEQEEAWNTGFSLAFYIPLLGRTLKLNTEYYYTHFLRQTLIDYDSNPSQIRLANLRGRSRSHTFQMDATYPVIDDMEFTLAYRISDVRSTYADGRFLERPLQSRWKGLATVSYKPSPGLWQFDVTCQVNGSGRLPTGYPAFDGTMPEGASFPVYPQLSAQVTRWFRHVSIYLGGENLTNYRQPHPILGADNPWSADFEPTMVWGPVHGITAYVGLRVNLGKRL
ncbi:MAG: TonB-dependent receptor [Bacteroidaceae bacterium]|nr:TonB-dependent receptor [Bacteroidaceae bacterium]